MGIACQILQAFRWAERRLSVDDPVLPEQRPKKSTKRLVCADGLQTAGEEKLAAPECPLQTRHELATEEAGEHFDREQKRVTRMDPLLVI